jgi:hypothetical protein
MSGPAPAWVYPPGVQTRYLLMASAAVAFLILAAGAVWFLVGFS